MYDLGVKQQRYSGDFEKKINDFPSILVHVVILRLLKISRWDPLWQFALGPPPASVPRKDMHMQFLDTYFWWPFFFAYHYFKRCTHLIRLGNQPPGNFAQNYSRHLPAKSSPARNDKREHFFSVRVRRTRNSPCRRFWLGNLVNNP